MREHHVGAVVIVDDRADARKPLGLLTDRDIAVELLALGIAPDTLNVYEVVQRPVTCVDQSAGYAETVRLMSANGVRRMPVTDRVGNLVGIITLDDVLRQLAAPLMALGDLVTRERRFEATTRR